jgi:hypothetical protein
MLLDRLERLLQLGLGEARHDVLRAIQAGARPRARPCFVARRREAPRQIGVVLQLSQFREREELEPPAVRVVHQQERGTVVGADIADSDVLPIAWTFAKPSFLSSSTLKSNPGGPPLWRIKTRHSPERPGRSCLGWMNSAAARLGGLVAVAALGCAFGSTSASAFAFTVAEAYRHVV